MGIVSFSNFGKWSHRTHIALFGRMPKVGIGAREWYDTSNIHLFTRSDFVQLCREDGIRILDMVCIPDNWVSKVLVGVRLCNLGADRVVAKITRSAAETGTI